MQRESDTNDHQLSEETQESTHIVEDHKDGEQTQPSKKSKKQKKKASIWREDFAEP